MESALKRGGVGAVTSRKRWRGRGSWHASQRGEGARHSHIMTCPTLPRWNLPLLRRPRTYQSLRRPSPRPQTLPKTRTLHIFSAREPRRGSSSSGRRSDEAERAHLNALKQARIEAHNERMALQRRMSGVGGRPTNAASVVAAANGSRLGQARASAHLALSPEAEALAHTSAPT